MECLADSDTLEGRVAVTLDSVPFFRTIAPDARRDLSRRGRIREFPIGSTLMRQGDASETMYVILSGRVRVERASADLTAPQVLAEFGPDEVVGEVGVLDGGARTATVTAVTETRALELHRTALAVVLIEYPAVAAELLRILSNRLRTADDLVEHILRDRSAGSGR